MQINTPQKLTVNKRMSARDREFTLSALLPSLALRRDCGIHFRQAAKGRYTENDEVVN